MTTQRRKIYVSANGDAWYLCRGRGGRLVVLHEPNRRLRWETFSDSSRDIPCGRKRWSAK